MNYSELLESDLLMLPFNQNKNISFRQYAFDKLDEYIVLLDSLDSNEIAKSHFNLSKDSIVIRQTEFVNGLKETISLYLDGYPAAAYDLLSQTIELRISKYKSLFKIDTYPAHEDFYRIRTINDNNRLTPDSFFHIPFENRGKVTSQRFSIPGFPSLYLGKSVYICWEELNRPNINEFHTIRLKSKNSIKYIDLAPPFFGDNIFVSQVYKYLMTWPLIFLCSIRVKNNFDLFKPEYIIPQLLLQWVRQNKEIDGIRYWSTHVDKNPTNFNGEFYNIVLPVKENKDYGLCDSLCNKFLATEIVSWQLHEFALGGANFMDTISDNIDSKMEYLELIKGMKYPYSYSVFGKIEKYLSDLKTKKIKPSVRLRL